MGKLVLIVDDEPLNCLLLDKQIEKQGCMSIIVTNGEEAISCYEYNHRKIDVILMDIRMPKMDGLEATKEIRKIEKKNKWLPVPIIAVSASLPDQQAEEGAITVGCDSYVSKPYDFDELFNIMKKYCNGDKKDD